MKPLLILLSLPFLACNRDDLPVKAIIGVKVLDPSAAPVASAVVLIRGPRISRVGFESQLSVPPGAQRFEARGKFLVAAPVEIPPSGIPEISTRAQAIASIAKGSRVMFGMFQDDVLDEKLLVKLHNEETIFIPRLYKLEKQPEQLARALRNTRILADNHILLAIGAGESLAREIGLMTQAGLSPKQIFEAATTTSAYAARRAGQLGAVRENLLADLWLLDEDPLASPAALAHPAKIMKEGEWVE
jgi:hypothetical protein